MKNFRKISLTLLIAILSIGLLAGCAKKEEEKEEPEETEDVKEVDEKETDGDKEDEEKEDEPEEVDLAEGPEKESVEDMNNRASDIVESNKEVLTEIKAKDNKDWHDIVFVFTDDFIEEIESMEKSELDAKLKELRAEVFDSMGRSGVLNFKSDNETITVYYEDVEGNEVVDKSVIDPD